MNIRKLKAIRFVNVGEDPPRPKPNWVSRRQWDAYIEYNFISAGQGLIYNQPLLNLEVDDIIAAFITGRGYVGIGIVTEPALPIKHFHFRGRKLEQLNIDSRYIDGNLINNETVGGLPHLRKTIFCNANNSNSEYAVRIHWQKTVEKKRILEEEIWAFCNPIYTKQLKRPTNYNSIFRGKFWCKIYLRYHFRRGWSQILTYCYKAFLKHFFIRYFYAKYQFNHIKLY